MKKGKKLYEGKAKIIFASPEKNMVIQLHGYLVVIQTLTINQIF